VPVRELLLKSLCVVRVGKEMQQGTTTTLSVHAGEKNACKQHCCAVEAYISAIYTWLLLPLIPGIEDLVPCHMAVLHMSAILLRTPCN